MNSNKSVSAKPINNTSFDVFGILHMLFALTVLAWLNSGIFSYTTPYIPYYLRWGFFIIWFGIAIINNQKFFFYLITHSWPLLVFHFYLLLIALFSGNILVLNFVQTLSYLIMVYAILLYYFGDKCRAYSKILSGFIAIDLTVIAINTFLKLQENPMIARHLSAGIESLNLIFGGEAFYCVGSFGYFYALVSVILLLGFLFLFFHKGKILLLLGIFTLVGLLIQASFTIAILLTFIFLMLLIILRYTNKYTVALLPAILLVFPAAFVFIVWILVDAQILPHEVAVRFIELSTFLSGESISGSDLNDRFDLYLRSIDAFINNIFFGVMLSDDKAYSSGGHSSWLDLLANYGLCSGLFFFFLFKAYKYCMKRVPEKFKLFIRVYWLYFICLGFINPVLGPSFFLVWFLFMPMIITSFFDEIPSK